MTPRAASDLSSGPRSISPLARGARLLLPIALHVWLFVGVYQMGFTRSEVHALVKPGHRLIEPYIEAARRYGAMGVFRTYFYGESDERL